MRKRDCRVEIYFTRSELDSLTEKVRKSGLSRESFCRRVLNGAQVREAPPADVPKLIREMRRVGVHLNEILRIALTRGLLDGPKLRKAMEELNDVEKLIVDTYAPGPE